MKLTFTLISRQIRDAVLARVQAAPDGWRITIDEGKRTDEQNARFHAAVGFLAERVEHFGRKLSVRSWKAVFMHELAKERGWPVDLIPSLDGSEIIYVGRSTSDLSWRDFSDLIELVYSEGAKNGVIFYEPRLDPDWRPKRAGKPKRGVTRDQLASGAQEAA